MFIRETHLLEDKSEHCHEVLIQLSTRLVRNGGSRSASDKFNRTGDEVPIIFNRRANEIRSKG